MATIFASELSSFVRVPNYVDSKSQSKRITLRNVGYSQTVRAPESIDA